MTFELWRRGLNRGYLPTVADVAMLMTMDRNEIRDREWRRGMIEAIRTLAARPAVIVRGR